MWRPLHRDGKPIRHLSRAAAARAPRARLGRVARLDAGEIDAFELDDLIHRYEGSARELWNFCGQRGSGLLTAARTLEYLQERGEHLPDWWAVW